MVGVIKQQSQFRNTAIRTARFQNVTGDKTQAILNAVDKGNSILLKEVQKDMEKETSKMLMKSSDEYIAMEDGKPKLLSTKYLAGMGANQRDLYINSVKKNHAAAIEKDIQRKLTSLKIDYRTRSNGAALFETAGKDFINNYIEAMGAEGEFKTFAFESATQQFGDALLHLREQRAVTQFRENENATFNRVEENINKASLYLDILGGDVTRPEYLKLKELAKEGLEDFIDQDLKQKAQQNINKLVTETTVAHIMNTLNDGSDTSIPKRQAVISFLSRGKSLSDLKEELNDPKLSSLLDEVVASDPNRDQLRRLAEGTDKLLISATSTQNAQKLKSNATEESRINSAYYQSYLNASTPEAAEAVLTEWRNRTFNQIQSKDERERLIEIAPAIINAQKTNNPNDLKLALNYLTDVITEDQLTKNSTSDVTSIIQLKRSGLDTTEVFNIVRSKLTQITSNEKAIKEAAESAEVAYNYENEINTPTSNISQKDQAEYLNNVQPEMSSFSNLENEDKELMLTNFNRNRQLSETNRNDLLDVLSGNATEKTTLEVLNFLTEAGKLPTFIKRSTGEEALRDQNLFMLDPRLDLNDEQRVQLESLMELYGSLGADKVGDISKIIAYSRIPLTVDQKQILYGDKSTTQFIVDNVLKDMDIFSPRNHGTIANKFNDFLDYQAKVIMNNKDIDDDDKTAAITRTVREAIKRRYFKPHRWQTTFLGDDAKRIEGSLALYEGSEELQSFENKVIMELNQAIRKGERKYSFEPENELNPDEYERVQLLTIVPNGKQPQFLAIDENNEVIMWQPPTDNPNEDFPVDYLAWSLDELFGSEAEKDFADVRLKPLRQANEKREVLAERKEETEELADERIEGARLSARDKQKTLSRQEKIKELQQKDE